MSKLEMLYKKFNIIDYIISSTAGIFNQDGVEYQIIDVCLEGDIFTLIAQDSEKNKVCMKIDKKWKQYNLPRKNKGI